MIFEKSTGEMRGPSLDGFENAKINGALQFEESQKVTTTQISINLKSSLHSFKNFAKNCCAPAHGVAFAEGTLDGLGIPKTVGSILKKVLALLQWIQSFKMSHQEFLKLQHPKAIFLDHRTETFLGINYKFFKYLSFIPDPLVKEISKQTKRGALGTHPWTPTHLPLQLINLGHIVIIGVPGEITTMAGYRLKNSLKNIILIPLYFYGPIATLLWAILQLRKNTTNSATKADTLSMEEIPCPI